MIITLLCDGVLDYARCIDLFGISPRQFQRDLRHIRELGRAHSFGVSHSKSGRVLLSTTIRRVSKVSSGRRDGAAMLARIAAAFGGPIAAEVREAIGDAPDGGDTFLQVREPRPSASERVTKLFEQLKSAAADCARVEFSYTPARGPRSERRVEPYHIVARLGRYYLVAYDLLRRDWRYFALDAIGGALRRAGTFTRRPVPPRYLADRAVGWIGGSGGGDVKIYLSSKVAASVGARTWQLGQRVEALPDGGSEITLEFDDLNEAVRWSLQFGTEARIVSPPEAVALARQTAAAVAAAYAAAASAAHRRRTA